MLPLSFVLEFVCLFAMVGGMLCKSDKPSIILLLPGVLYLDSWIIPGRIPTGKPTPKSMPPTSDERAELKAYAPNNAAFSTLVLIILSSAH